MLRRQRAYFWIGLLSFAVSFFLVAVVDAGGPKRGYVCAWLGFADALAWMELLRLFDAVALIVTGLINPLFVLAVVVALRTGRGGSLFKGLRAAIVLMMPLCWVVFCYHHVTVREGYALWTLGMLLSLFSPEVPNTAIEAPNLRSHGATGSAE